MIQSGLQSITHRLPGPVSSLGSLILGQECYTTLIYNVDPTLACLKLGLSKGLGIGIIIFGSILKIPQIFKIVRHSSARGISLTMYSLEVVAYDISLAYAYRRELPFSTYGENASLTVQNMLITLLIIWYDPKGKLQGGLLTTPGSSVRVGFGISNSLQPVLVSAFLMIVSSIFLFILCPPTLLSILQAFSIPISLVSKIPQIVELHRNKEPGQLSAVVVFAQLLGTIARVYTTVVETGDWLLGIGFGLASVLNAVIAIQYVYYWDGGNSSPSSLPLSAALSDWKKSDGDVNARHNPPRERMRHATINLSIDATGNEYPYPLGGSSRNVSEKKSRVD